MVSQLSHPANIFYLAVEGKLLGFYREDTGEKLLLPDELLTALREEMRRRAAAEDRAEQAEDRAEQVEQARREAVPKLLAMGLSIAQAAEALGLTVDEVRAMGQKEEC
jgi:predicted transposase YdaD